MTDQKKKIDMHVKIASKILGEIKSRQMDKLQDIEDEILQNRKTSGENKQDITTLLALETREQDAFLDKVRVLVIMILCLSDLDQLQKFIESVEAVHPTETETMGKLKIMFQKKKALVSPVKTEQTYVRSLTMGLASGLSSILGTDNMQDILAGEVTQVISTMQYQQPGVKYFDCLTGDSVAQVPKTPEQVFAFSFGGGSFHEYESLKSLESVKIVYGCDFIY